MTARIAINLLWCVPGVGGSEEYLLRQIRGMSENTHQFNIDVFVPKGFGTRHDNLPTGVRFIEAPSTCTRRVVRIFLEHTWLAWRTRSYDLVHHGGGTMPRITHRVSVMTLHDIQWTAFPNYVAPVKLKYLQRVVPSSLRRAKRVAVPTHFVASTVIDNFNIPPEKISVVRHGVEVDVLTNKTSEAELRQRWSLGNGPVLAYLAITHPHKNHLFLLKLMASGCEGWSDEDMKLVFAGSAGSVDDEVRSFVRSHHLENRVVMPGRISPSDRNGLVACADAVVFPSQYEGFGAPLIEAMHLGAPILASDCACIPEVVGDAGVIAPLESDAWVHALQRLRREKQELITRGYQRARQFTTTKSGEEILSLYRSVLDEVQR